MKRQKVKLLRMNAVVFYIKEVSSVYKHFYKYKGGALSYGEFFDIVEELNNVIYCNYFDKKFIAEAGQTDFTDRYKLYR